MPLMIPPGKKKKPLCKVIKARARFYRALALYFILAATFFKKYAAV